MVQEEHSEPGSLCDDLVLGPDLWLDAATSWVVCCWEEPVPSVPGWVPRQHVPVQKVRAGDVLGSQQIQLSPRGLKVAAGGLEGCI